MRRKILVFGFSTVLLSACATVPREIRPIVYEVEAPGVSRAILRASAARSAIVTSVIRDAPFVTVAGIPSRDAGGSQKALGFVSQRFGSTLVISATNEINRFHHHYRLERLYVTIPRSMRLIRESRVVN